MKRKPPFFLLVLTALLITALAFAGNDPVEDAYRKGMIMRREYFPLSAQKIFKSIIKEHPAHPRAQDAEGQLALIDFDMRLESSFLEKSRDFLQNNPSSPLAEEMEFTRLRSLARSGAGPQARQELSAFSLARPQNALRDKLPLLELESYIRCEKPEGVAGKSETLSKCEGLVTQALEAARRTKDHESYEIALYYGILLAESSGKRESFLFLLGNEEKACPRELRWVLRQKTLQFKGEIKPVERAPQTPRELKDMLREGMLNIPSNQ